MLMAYISQKTIMRIMNSVNISCMWLVCFQKEEATLPIFIFDLE